MDSTRRQFLRTALQLGAAGLTLSACDGGSSSTVEPYHDAGSDFALLTTISANHGHVLTVPMSDLRARVDKTYSIQGTAEHNHSVTISADDFVTLWNEGTLTRMSTSAGHSHSVMLIY